MSTESTRLKELGQLAVAPNRGEGTGIQIPKEFPSRGTKVRVLPAPSRNRDHDLCRTEIQYSISESSPSGQKR